MWRETENKIIIVIRQTRVDELISRFNTVEQAKFYIEHSGADFSDYWDEHTRYYASLKAVEQTLSELGRVQVVEKRFLPNFIFDAKDIVVTLGQDGLVVNTAKYLNGQCIVGINPDPQRFNGILLPFLETDLEKILPEIFAQKRPVKEVTMAKAELNDGQTLYGVNDIFIGPKSHTSARYVLQIASVQESQSSSGIIVSTGFGATGWLTSILKGANGVSTWIERNSPSASISDGNGMREEEGLPVPTSWDMECLYYTVREPFPSKVSSTNLVFGRIESQTKMTITSQMPENGVIFSDGIEKDFLVFNSGAIATIGIAEKKVRVIV